MKDRFCAGMKSTGEERKVQRRIGGYRGGMNSSTGGGKIYNI